MNTDNLSNENETPILRIGAVMPSVFDSPEKERGIMIVGQGHVGRNDIALRAAELAAQNIKVVVIGDNSNDMNTIEINGIKYQQKEHEKRKPMSKTLMALMVMSEMANGYGMYGNSKPKENPKVDIVKEFGLIQQKKSNLSKSERDWVVWQFERNFERVS